MNEDDPDRDPRGDPDQSEPAEKGREPAAGEDVADALSPSFRLTTAFLRDHPRYRQTLSLTPEHFRFDPVLWHSSVSALRAMLRSVAEERSIEASDDDLDVAVRNLVEGIVLRSRAWDD